MSYQFNDNGDKEYFQINYVQKYYEELFLGMLNTSHEEGLISHNDRFTEYVKSRRDISSYYVMTLSIIADNIEEVYYDMNDVLFSNKVYYAIGTDLDDIGAIIGCPRPNKTSASANVTFKRLSSVTEDILIPAGTIVSTVSGISYYTSVDKIITSDESSVDIECIAMEKGINSKVHANTLIVCEDVVDADISVTNDEPSSGGYEEYTDDEYRSLLMEWVGNQTKGSTEAFHRYFSNFDGIDGYKLIPNWNGISGTLKIVLDPGNPTQLQRAYKEIKEYVCQIDDDIVMFPPERVDLEVYASVNVDYDATNPFSSSEKAEIQSKIVEVVKVFIEGNDEYSGLEIGEDFIPFQLGVFISEVIPEVKNIVFTNNDFSELAEPVVITDEEIGRIEDANIHIVME